MGRCCSGWCLYCGAHRALLPKLSHSTLYWEAICVGVGSGGRTDAFVSVHPSTFHTCASIQGDSDLWGSKKRRTLKFIQLVQYISHYILLKEYSVIQNLQGLPELPIQSCERCMRTATMPIFITKQRLVGIPCHSICVTVLAWIRSACYPISRPHPAPLPVAWHGLIGVLTAECTVVHSHSWDLP